MRSQILAKPLRDGSLIAKLCANKSTCYFLKRHDQDISAKCEFFWSENVSDELKVSGIITQTCSMFNSLNTHLEMYHHCFGDQTRLVHRLNHAILNKISVKLSFKMLSDILNYDIGLWFQLEATTIYKRYLNTLLWMINLITV